MATFQVWRHRTGSDYRITIANEKAAFENTQRGGAEDGEWQATISIPTMDQIRQVEDYVSRLEPHLLATPDLFGKRLTEDGIGTIDKIIRPV